MHSNTDAAGEPIKLRKLPVGAIDTHFHVFGPENRYPYAEGRSYTPPDASFEDWLKGAKDIGLAGGVLVQASVHGFDNSQIVDMLRASPLPLRGVAAIRADISDNELADLDELGFRGARINTVFNAGMGLEAARDLAPRIRDSGWHLEFLSDVSQIAGLRAFVEGLGVPVVFAHFGHVPANQAMTNGSFRDLVELVRDGIAWVKLSGPARISREPFPPFKDVEPLASALIDANPHRLLWGSDWPHTSISRRAPSMLELSAMAWTWLGDHAEQVMVKNPQRLYGFPSCGPA